MCLYYFRKHLPFYYHNGMSQLTLSILHHPTQQTSMHSFWHEKIDCQINKFSFYLDLLRKKIFKVSEENSNYSLGIFVRLFRCFNESSSNCSIINRMRWLKNKLVLSNDMWFKIFFFESHTRLAQQRDNFVNFKKNSLQFVHSLTSTIIIAKVMVLRGKNRFILPFLSKNVAKPSRNLVWNFTNCFWTVSQSVGF